MEIVLRIDDSLIILSEVEVRTLKTSQAFRLLARFSFIIQRMVLLFLPAVAFQASSLEVTALLIFADKSSRLPVLAQRKGVNVRK